MRFGAQRSCKMSKGAHFDCAFSAGKIQDFHSKTVKMHAPVISTKSHICDILECETEENLRLQDSRGQDWDGQVE